MFGSSEHQQLESVNVAPHPKLVPHFEQLFCVSRSLDAELIFSITCGRASCAHRTSENASSSLPAFQKFDCWLDYAL